MTIFILYIVSTCHNSHNTHELSCLFVAFLSQSDNHCIYGWESELHVKLFINVELQWIVMNENQYIGIGTGG